MFPTLGLLGKENESRFGIKHLGEIIKPEI
jgi:hypothetical protein